MQLHNGDPIRSPSFLFNRLKTFSHQSASTRCGGNEIDTSVPSPGAETISNCARLASTIALVSGSPSPVPSPRCRGPGPTWPNGFIACSASTPAYRVAACGALNIVTDLLGQDPLTEDEFIAGFEIGAYPDFVQAEMVWRSTQPAGDYLQLTAEVSPTDGADIGSVNGQSPLVLKADNATITAAGMHTSKYMQQRVFNMEHEATTPPVPVCDIPNPVHGGTMCAKGLGLTLDQKFQVFTHVFHKFVPEESWLFIESGSPQVPDQ